MVGRYAPGAIPPGIGKDACLVRSRRSHSRASGVELAVPPRGSAELPAGQGRIAEVAVVALASDTGRPPALLASCLRRVSPSGAEHG